MWSCSITYARLVNNGVCNPEALTQPRYCRCTGCSVPFLPGAGRLQRRGFNEGSRGVPRCRCKVPLRGRLNIASYCKTEGVHGRGCDCSSFARTEVRLISGHGQSVDVHDSTWGALVRAVNVLRGLDNAGGGVNFSGMVIGPAPLSSLDNFSLVARFLANQHL